MEIVGHVDVVDKKGVHTGNMMKSSPQDIGCIQRKHSLAKSLSCSASAHYECPGLHIQRLHMITFYEDQAQTMAQIGQM